MGGEEWGTPGKSLNKADTFSFLRAIFASTTVANLHLILTCRSRLTGSLPVDIFYLEYKNPQNYYQTSTLAYPQHALMSTS